MEDARCGRAQALGPTVRSALSGGRTLWRLTFLGAVVWLVTTLPLWTMRSAGSAVGTVVVVVLGSVVVGPDVEVVVVSMVPVLLVGVVPWVHAATTRIPTNQRYGAHGR